MRKTNAATGGKLLGLYLHIPFCVKKCAYCDFYSITDASLKADYTAALIRDIKAYGERCSGYTVDTVYIGGGTPTCLGAGYLSEILQAVGACFAIAENAEITVECNPESTDQAVLEAMHKHGVNRLSFGVQAAHDTELKRIGRIHDFAQAQAAVELARQCGFTNISLDLMYGLPDQTQAQFLDSVTQCLTLNPQHFVVLRDSNWSLQHRWDVKIRFCRMTTRRQIPILPCADCSAGTASSTMKYQISQNRVFVPGIISNTGIFPTISDWTGRPFFPEWPPVRVCPGYQGLYQR